MKIGTKSLLFGAHQFLIHPVFVFAAWWRLYGFPWNPRLWFAFVVHDWGYWQCADMDDDEGEYHIFAGARIMGWLFDRVHWFHQPFSRHPNRRIDHPYHASWYCFVFYHSRYISKIYNILPSRLCLADKLSIALEPTWFYLFWANLSGEVKEYRNAVDDKYAHERLDNASQKIWFESVKVYLKRWVAEHKDGKPDTWTVI